MYKRQLLHLLALGVILCLAWYPHFGRPYDPPRQVAGDFGRYLKGVGEMLARTGNTAYAHEKINEWRKTAKKMES